MLVNVHGTQLFADDTREHYREKIARITLDSMVQFVGLLDAKGTVLESITSRLMPSASSSLMFRGVLIAATRSADPHY